MMTDQRQQHDQFRRSPAFDSHAASYDVAARAQREVGEQLLAFTQPQTPRRILEPGCGTGVYTGMLHAAFPDAALLGIDISAPALAVARRKFSDTRLVFRLADAERFLDGQYDLISANAVFQWFADLPGTLANMRCMLTPGGALTFSYFGPRTYCELAVALREVFGEQARVSSEQFVDACTVQSLLQAHFSVVDMQVMTLRQRLPRLRDLLVNIRQTGTRGAHYCPLPWTPQRYARVEAVYIDRHGGIDVSYQVFLCKGQL